VEEIVLWAQLVTGLELDPGGTIHELSSPAWRECRQRWGTLHQFPGAAARY
jgi:hypothetical protein